MTDSDRSLAFDYAHKLISERLSGKRKSKLSEVRARTYALPCPLCKSQQIQVCLDSNNPMKDFAKCRMCHCQAPLKTWNNR